MCHKETSDMFKNKTHIHQTRSINTKKDPSTKHTHLYTYILHTHTHTVTVYTSNSTPCIPTYYIHTHTPSLCTLHTQHHADTRWEACL